MERFRKVLLLNKQGRANTDAMAETSRDLCKNSSDVAGNASGGRFEDGYELFTWRIAELTPREKSDSHSLPNSLLSSGKFRIRAERRFFVFGHLSWCYVPVDQNCLVKELSLCGIYVYSGLKFWSRCSGLKNMSKTHH